jgi:hypothetical protein
MAGHTVERRTPAFLSLVPPLHDEDEVLSRLRRRLAAAIPAIPDGVEVILVKEGGLPGVVGRKGPPADDPVGLLRERGRIKLSVLCAEREIPLSVGRRPRAPNGKTAR